MSPHDISYFTKHKGWKGFYTPLLEFEDGTRSEGIKMFNDFIDKWEERKANYEKDGYKKGAKFADKQVKNWQKRLKKYKKVGNGDNSY